MAEEKTTTVGLTLAQRFSVVTPPNIKYLIEQLNEVEYKIARMTADGLTSEKMSADLGISDIAIKTHRKNIYKKLQITHSIPALCVAMDGPVPPGCEFKGLTCRQNDIARLLFVGMSGKEIGLALSIEEKTVKNHTRKIREALKIGGDIRAPNMQARLMKALRAVMIHDEAYTKWLNVLYDAQEKATDETIALDLG